VGIKIGTKVVWSILKVSVYFSLNLDEMIFPLARVEDFWGNEID